MRKTNDEPKVTVGAVVPISWRDELEKMARAERKTVSELVRDIIDKSLHSQSTQCHDDVARQVIRIIIDLLQLYCATDCRANPMDR
jgi:ERCC4-type nuclease